MSTAMKLTEGSVKIISEHLALKIETVQAVLNLRNNKGALSYFVTDCYDAQVDKVRPYINMGEKRFHEEFAFAEPQRLFEFTPVTRKSNPEEKTDDSNTGGQSTGKLAKKASLGSGSATSP